MAHKKAAASTASQKSNRQGKHLGIKASDGQIVRTGMIIVRQRGRNYVAGENVQMGKDFTLFSVSDGKVKFGNYSSKQKLVSVIPLQ